MYQYIRPGKVLAALQWFKSTIQGHRDQRLDDAELWEALSAEHCPPPPLSPTVTMTSQLMNGERVLIDLF